MYPQCRRREHCVVRSSRISALPGDISMNRVLVAILFLFLPASSLADDLFDIKPVGDGIYAGIAKPDYEVNYNAAAINFDDVRIQVETHSKLSTACFLFAEITKSMPFSVKFVIK